MNLLLKEIRHNPLLWLLAFVPAVFIAAQVAHDSHTLLFVLSVFAIVPLAALLSHATESVAARTGDTIGGLLNATFGNMTELVITLTALRTPRSRSVQIYAILRERRRRIASRTEEQVSPYRIRVGFCGGL